jgi:DNA-binding NarL/FixJ family response regulator
MKIKLTRRETQVLELIAEGKANKEISNILHISVSTTKNHISNLMSKLGVRNRTQAAVIYRLERRSILTRFLGFLKPFRLQVIIVRKRGSS